MLVVMPCHQPKNCQHALLEHRNRPQVVIDEIDGRAGTKVNRRLEDIPAAAVKKPSEVAAPSSCSNEASQSKSCAEQFPSSRTHTKSACEVSPV